MFPEKLEDWHHAYVINGSGVQDVLNSIKGVGIKIVGNPDVIVREYQMFGIKDARNLSISSVFKPLSGKKFFVISCASINQEAQNALLKTIEEPSGESIFIFVLPNTSSLLPTFLSRTQQIINQFIGHSVSYKLEGGVCGFVEASLQERIKMVSELVPKKGEEKDLKQVFGFLSELEVFMSNLEKRDENWRAGISAIYNAKKYLADKGASLKILLESVALLVPEK